MRIYRNLIANDEHLLQAELDRAVSDGWGNPSNPTITHWEERMYSGNEIRGTNNYTQWTQVVSKDSELEL